MGNNHGANNLTTFIVHSHRTNNYESSVIKIMSKRFLKWLRKFNFSYIRSCHWLPMTYCLPSSGIFEPRSIYQLDLNTHGKKAAKFILADTLVAGANASGFTRFSWNIQNANVASFGGGVASCGGGLIKISKISCNPSLWCITMVANTTDIVMSYEERVRSMASVPRLSYGRRMLRSDGGPNGYVPAVLWTSLG
jgi:hypothetical protein